MRIAAAWEQGGRHWVGVLRMDGAALRVEASLALPSRPHAVRVEPGGSVLAVARRPGDWLLRWHPDGAMPAWCWIESDRCFNGHVLPSLDGQRMFTTETDLDTGQSLLGVRDTASLHKLAEWPTHGMDAHDLVHDHAPDGAGAVLVANGGVPAAQESGRLKLDLAAMDSSLVRLDAVDGRLRGQWRLSDARSSLRHLAWSAADARGRRVLGVALQAEHGPVGQRARASVLARFDGTALRPCPLPDGIALAGYGGDVAAVGRDFAVGCPRADAVAWWCADGQWRGVQAQPRACALLTAAGPAGEPVLWAGGLEAVAWPGGTARPLLPQDGSAGTGAALRLDNHWAWLPAAAGPGFNLITKELT